MSKYDSTLNANTLSNFFTEFVRSEFNVIVMVPREK